MLSKEAKDKLVEVLNQIGLAREAERLGDLLEPPSEKKVREWFRLADERLASKKRL